MVNKIPEISTALITVLGVTVETFQTSFPDLEIHGIKVDGKFNYVTKKLEYCIYADVRGKGQIFLGMSN